MTSLKPEFVVTLAQSARDRRLAQRLRYEVFVQELGATGEAVDHDLQLEVDPFDAHADHLLLWDRARPTDQQVVGTYRMMSAEQAAPLGFSSDDEFDHAALRSSGETLLELSRSCVHPDYRDGQGMFLLWQALSEYVLDKEVGILFGVASFWAASAQVVAEPLSLLQQRHLADAQVRPVSRMPAEFDLYAPQDINKVDALQATPALIKAYLRLGGKVGEGAFVDHAFGTVDVCMVVKTSDINARQRAIYARQPT